MNKLIVRSEISQTVAMICKNRAS